MFKEINEHIINISEVKYISKGGGQYFKFMVGTKEFEWLIEFRQELIDALDKSTGTMYVGFPPINERVVVND